QLRQTGRRVGDPPNTLQGSALIQAGLAAYTGGRWGDYFGICRDGGSASTVWMYGEYTGNANTWRTRVAAVMLPAPTAPTLTLPTQELEQLRDSLRTTIQQTLHEARTKTPR